MTEQVASVSIKASDDLTWDQIDDHAKSIDENRSTYLIKLVKTDLRGKNAKDYIPHLIILNTLAIFVLILLVVVI